MIKNIFQKSSLKRSKVYDDTLDIEEVWKAKRVPKEEIANKTKSKFFVDANLGKVTPKVSKKLRLLYRF